VDYFEIFVGVLIRNKSGLIFDFGVHSIQVIMGEYGLIWTNMGVNMIWANMDEYGLI
jgi:hypothetical protein